MMCDMIVLNHNKVNPTRGGGVLDTLLPFQGDHCTFKCNFISFEGDFTTNRH